MSNHSTQTKINEFYFSIEKNISNIESNLNLDQITPKKQNLHKWSVDYAITLTLKPVIYRHAPEKQFSLVSENIRNNFPNCQFTIIAELTKQYNIHFHGFIKVDLNKINIHPEKYLFDRIRKYSALGFAVIKQVTEYNVWKDYILKDKKNTESILNLDPVVRDDYGLKDPQEEDKKV